MTRDIKFVYIYQDFMSSRAQISNFRIDLQPFKFLYMLKGPVAQLVNASDS